MWSLGRTQAYSPLLENQSTGLLWLNGALQLEYLNPAAETLLELDALRCIGLPVTRILPEAVDLISVLKRVLEHPEIVTRRELGVVVGTVQTSHTVTADCTVSPVMEKPGEIRLLVELVPQDRHLRISREAALITQNAANRSLAHKLAHEIKNPLGGLRGAAQLLTRRLQDPGLLEYTRIIVAEADRLTSLVDALLGPNQAPQRSATNIHELLEHVARLLSPVSTGQLNIRRDYDPSLPLLRVDRNQIIQVVLNLAKNASEACGERGVIVFRSRALRQFTLHGIRHRLVACVELEDAGPGIAPELLQQLFSPMVSQKPHGAGLGLSIAQELASRHGGLIECTSKPGCTVFSLLLPVDSDDAREAR